MTFTQHEISRLKLLRAMASEFLLLEQEVSLATAQLPEIFKAETTAREALTCFLPSQIVAWQPAVEATCVELRKAELQRSALKESHQLMASKLTVLKGNIDREVQELIPALREKVKASFAAPTGEQDRVLTNHGAVTAECSAAMEELAFRRGAKPTTRADALLALCIQLGAELPAAVEN